MFNIKRHFHIKHLNFSEKYTDGDNRRKAIESLLNETQNQQRSLSSWEILVFAISGNTNIGKIFY